MASQGPNAAGASVTGSGDYSWADSTAATGASDDAYAYIANNLVFQDTLVQLYDIGTVTALGADQSTSTDIDPPDPPVYRTYGGASNLWGATLTPAIVNDADFGVIIQWTYPGDSSLTETIWLGNFGFSVPGTATIDGFLFEVRLGPNNAGDFFPGIDNVRATVYYTEAAAGGQPYIARVSGVPGVRLGGASFGRGW